MTAEQNFDWLDKQVEGLLNDFEGGESTLQETKNGFYEIIFDKLIKQIQEQQDYKQEIDEAKHQGQVELLRRIIQDMFNASALNIPMDYIYHLKKEIAPSPKESE